MPDQKTDNDNMPTQANLVGRDHRPQTVMTGGQSAPKIDNDDHLVGVPMQPTVRRDG